MAVFGSRNHQFLRTRVKSAEGVKKCTCYEKSRTFPDFSEITYHFMQKNKAFSRFGKKWEYFKKIQENRNSQKRKRKKLIFPKQKIGFSRSQNAKKYIS